MSEIEEKTGVTEEVEELIKINTAQLRSDLAAALKVIDGKDKEIANLKIALATMKEHVEAEAKSKIMDELSQFINYGTEYLSAMQLPRLEQLLEDCKNMKLPRFSSSADFGGTVKDPYEKLHNMFKFGKK